MSETTSVPCSHRRGAAHSRRRGAAHSRRRGATRHPETRHDTAHGAAPDTAPDTVRTGRAFGARRAFATGLAALAPVLIPIAVGPASASAATATPSALAAPAHEGHEGDAECRRGEFCLWSQEDYHGDILRLDLRTANPEACVALPGGMRAHAFANRIDRHVTVYQEQHCATEGDFSTYPGPGTFVPRSPYVVRAIKIWT